MLGAVVFGHEQQQIVIQNINDLVKEAGKPRWDWQPEAVNEALNARVAALAEARLSDAYRITDKQERYAQVDVIKSETIAAGCRRRNPGRKRTGRNPARDREKRCS